MRLLSVFVCAITVTYVMAGSALVQVNIGTDAVAAGLCDDGDNGCQGNGNNQCSCGSNGGTCTCGSNVNNGKTGNGNIGTNNNGNNGNVNNGNTGNGGTDGNGNNNGNTENGNTGNTGNSATIGNGNNDNNGNGNTGSNRNSGPENNNDKNGNGNPAPYVSAGNNGTNNGISSDNARIGDIGTTNNNGNENGNTGINNGNTGNGNTNNGNTNNNDNNNSNTGNGNSNNNDNNVPSNGTPTTPSDTSIPPTGHHSGNSNDYCYVQVEGTCAAKQNKIFCKSSYGDFKPMEGEFSQMVRNIMRHSYEYLSLYIQHSNYLVNRKGFSKMYRELSDYKWNLAKYVITYITERGGVMQFSTPPPPPPCGCSDEHDPSDHDDSSTHSMYWDLIDGPIANAPSSNGSTSEGSTNSDGEYNGNPDGYELQEVVALAFSSDIEKEIAITADALHMVAIGPNGHDVQSAMYLQETIITPHRKIIGNLVRYVNMLSQMLTGMDQMESLYHFDDLLWSFSVFN